MLSSTTGVMLQFLSVAKVLVCSSESVAGGGVLGDCTSSEELEFLRPWWNELTYDEVVSSN